MQGSYPDKLKETKTKVMKKGNEMVKEKEKQK